MLLRKGWLLLFLGFLFIGCGSEQKSTQEGDQVRQYAGELLNKQLYKDAIEQYEIYLRDFKVDEREQANVNYIIANTYFDRLKDYEAALTFYLKIKHFYPESSLIDQVNKRIVACLERLDRSQDAQQALEETVQMDPDQITKRRPGAVVAKIGDREITQGDVDFEISQLHPSVRSQLENKEGKLDFLREYVATELLYDTAKRAGLDNDPEVIEGAFQAKKMLMVQKLLQQRVAEKVDIKPEDVKLYFDANKDKYAEKDDDGNIVKQADLQQIQQQVAQDLYKERYQAAYRELMDKMILAEEVKFYENEIQ